MACCHYAALSKQEVALVSFLLRPFVRRSVGRFVQCYCSRRGVVVGVFSDLQRIRYIAVIGRAMAAYNK